MPRRLIRIGGETETEVGSHRNLLSPADPKRKLGPESERMLRKELIKTVIGGEPIVIIVRTQQQVVQLWNEVTEPRARIEAPEIEVRKSIVIEILLPDADTREKRVGNPRREADADRRGKKNVVFLSPARECGVRGVRKRRRNCDGKRLILL